MTASCQKRGPSKRRREPSSPSLRARYILFYGAAGQVKKSGTKGGSGKGGRSSTCPTSFHLLPRLCRDKETRTRVRSVPGSPGVSFQAMPYHVPCRSGAPQLNARYRRQRRPEAQPRGKRSAPQMVRTTNLRIRLLTAFLCRVLASLAPVPVGLYEGEVRQQAVVRGAPDRQRIVTTVGIEHVQHAAKAYGLRGAKAQLDGDALRSRAKLQRG